VIKVNISGQRWYKLLSTQGPDETTVKLTQAREANKKTSAPKKLLNIYNVFVLDICFDILKR
jgi:hypothetical protein